MRVCFLSVFLYLFVGSITAFCECRLVDLLDGWASTWGFLARHALVGRGSVSALVHLGDDRVADRFGVLLHGVEFVLLGMLGSLGPLRHFLNLGLDLPSLFVGNSRLELLLLDCVLHLGAVRLELVLSINALLGSLVLLGILLSLADHALDVVLGQTALIVGDGDVGLLAGCTLVLSCDIEHTVRVDVKGDLDLGHTTRSWRDPSELELAQQVVVLGAGALALVHLDEHTRLVVGVGGEGLRLLGWHSGVAGNKGGHHTTSSLETERQRSDVEEEEVCIAGGATSEHTCLDSSTIGHSLVGVDGAAWLLAIEERRDELVHLRDAGGATDHDDLVDAALVDLGVAQDLLDRLEGATEEVGAEVLEASTGDRGVEVDTLEQRVDLDASVGRGRKLALGALTGGTKT